VFGRDRRPLSAQTPESSSKSRVNAFYGWMVRKDVSRNGRGSARTGPEATVRTLLRAMEHPNSPATPARPQKIVVRDSQKFNSTYVEHSKNWK
jgi:hypothetical protein